MELSATELRIGNLVAFNYKCDIISKVNIIQEYSVGISFETQPNLMNALSTHPENLIPITLTEEWLVKFGFEVTNTYYFSKCNLHLQGDVRGFHLVISRIDGIKVKYVHELQNLYFALTGEELTI